MGRWWELWAHPGGACEHTNAVWRQTIRIRSFVLAHADSCVPVCATYWREGYGVVMVSRSISIRTPWSISVSRAGASGTALLAVPM